MPNEKKLEPVSDNHFRGMVTWYKLKGLVWNLQKHLDKIPLKEGMRVVDYGCGPVRYTVPAAKLVGAQGMVFAVDVEIPNPDHALRPGLPADAVIITEEQ